MDNKQIDKYDNIKRKRFQNRIILIIACLLAILLCVIAIFMIRKKLIKPQSNELKTDVTIQKLALNYQFTDRKITDSDSAVKAISDVADQLGIADPEKELTVISNDSIDGYDIYRMQQYYEGYKVFGHQIIVSADKSDNAYSLFSDYTDVSNVELKTAITAQQAEQAASKYISDRFSNFQLKTDDEMFIYSQDNIQAFCYVIEIYDDSNDAPSYLLFIDSNTGEVIFEKKVIYNSYSNAEDGAKICKNVHIIGEDGNEKILDLSEYKGKYQLFDISRNIKVFNCVDKEQKIITWEKEKECPEKVGISTLDNLKNSYNYYADMFGYYSTDGKAMNEIYVWINNTDRHNNAASGTNNDQYLTLIIIGTNDTITMGNQLDMVAHEYTHAVTDCKVNWSSHQGKALSEAYSDIMGAVIEWYITGKNDWKAGDLRDLTNPSNTLNEKDYHISNYSEYNYNLDEHAASTLISHVAYLMNKGYDDNEHHNSAIDMDLLGKLWFHSMSFLPSNCSFSDCRWAVTQTAEILGLSSTQQYCIECAFDEVGIPDLNQSKYYFVTKDFELQLLYAGEEEYSDNYEISIYKIDDQTNIFDISQCKNVLKQNITESAHKFSLEAGVYYVIAHDLKYENEETSFKLLVHESNNDIVLFKNSLTIRTRWIYIPDELSIRNLMICDTLSTQYLAYKNNDFDSFIKTIDVDEITKQELEGDWKGHDYQSVYDLMRGYQADFFFMGINYNYIDTSAFDSISGRIEIISIEPDESRDCQRIFFKIKDSDYIGEAMYQWYYDTYVFLVCLTKEKDKENDKFKVQEETLKAKMEASELTKAEKYAQIVIDNESLWLEPLALEYASQAAITTNVDCWFEDLDFDGSLEFIVGPTHIADGMSRIYYYDIYRFSDDSMSKLSSEAFEYNKVGASAAMIPNQLKDRNNMYLSIYKDHKGTYKYVYAVEESETEIYSVSELKVDNNTINLSELYCIPFNSDFTVGYRINSKKTDYDIFVSAIDEEIANDTRCIVNTQAIPLTNSCGEITSDCYSKKNNKIKTDLLIEAYNGYSISESTKVPELYEKLSEAAQSSKPKTQTKNSNTYKVISDVKLDSWEAAEIYCNNLGGHLATISSKEENDYIYSLMLDAGINSAYFGLTDKDKEGSWNWITGEKCEYVNWHNGEPNSENPNEDYAMFYWKYSDGTWNDGDFGGSTVNGGVAFICEWESNKNQNDPVTTKYIELAKQATLNNYWVVFKEGYRNNQIEMSSFDENGDFIVTWSKNLVCNNQKGKCNQYYLTNGKFEKVREYSILTDYATEIIASNFDIYDKDGNVVFSATSSS